MPLLPHVDRAIIPVAKIHEYLLCPHHRVGGPKCAYFTSFGFSPADPEVLMAALLDQAHRFEAVSVGTTEFGEKFVVSGSLPAPDGRLCGVRAVWIVDAGSTAPRLVTVVPAQGVL